MDSRRDRAMGPLRRQASDDAPPWLYLTITGAIIAVLVLAAYTLRDNIELPPPQPEAHTACHPFKPLTIRTYADGTQRALYLCMGPMPESVADPQEARDE